MPRSPLRRRCLRLRQATSITIARGLTIRRLHTVCLHSGSLNRYGHSQWIIDALDRALRASIGDENKQDDRSNHWRQTIAKHQQQRDDDIKNNSSPRRGIRRDQPWNGTQTVLAGWLTCWDQADGQSQLESVFIF